jgi:hypothetical protein
MTKNENSALTLLTLNLFKGPRPDMKVFAN